ncbi:uncharacterized protein BHQ10_010349 [Talaromyces amestolkiae]|uniref:Uncharacterized protein n=1 Tax=Talaromyces amestolkiae TaxID=1196081 RepID=A0A364LEW4_TALAM|nr:uncharacterized protein BHQ10_010349 [Talaromyces amestolkiae]RAO74337.1 hypothetical protein BHQ10_010349 [Talaromyces amestolkiae]
MSRAAHRRAGLRPDETGYVELHGTGTKVGDPIEMEAVARVFQRRDDVPTLVGGIKPTLGHSEEASCISSIIKVVLALERNLIPATIGVENVNPSIKLSEWNVDIVRTNREWPNAAVHRAGINSFGFGGANAHAVIEAGPSRALNGGHNTAVVKENGKGDSLCQYGDAVADKHVDFPGIYLFSANTRDSLMKQFDGIVDYISDKGVDLQANDLAYTLNCRRSQLGTRGFLGARTSSLCNEPSSLLPTIQPNRLPEKRDLSFVYTGQGAQWSGFGLEFLGQFPSFRQSIRTFDRCLQTLDKSVRPPWTIEKTILEKETDVINRADRSQAVCTAVQMAVIDLLYSWNIKPKTVIGHSSGEIAAAYAAGKICYNRAIISSYLRGFSVSLSQKRGGILATSLSRDEAKNVIADMGLSGTLSVACVNSPKSSTLSGDIEAIDKVLDALQNKGIFARKSKTDNKAYHSHHMQALGPVYEELLHRFWPNSTTDGIQVGNYPAKSHSGISMISSVTKAVVTDIDVCAPSYWRSNLESSVGFEKAVRVVLQGGSTHFVEIGPHSTLELPIKETANQTSNLQQTVSYMYHSALQRGKEASVSILNLVGSLFLNRHDEIFFKSILENGNDFNHEPAKVLTDLPAYPWDYSSTCTWNEPRIVAEFRNRRDARHDLLGSQIPGGSKANITWRNILNINEIPWLKDHRLGSSIVFPSAAYIAMATEAVCQVNNIPLMGCPGVTLKNISFLKAMDFDIEERPRIEVFTEMEPLRISNTTTSNKWWRFSVNSVSRDASQSILHAVCVASLSSNDTKVKSTRRQININRTSMEKQVTKAWYDKFTLEGLNWGPRFAVMEDILCDRAKRSYIAAATTHLVYEDSSPGYQNNHPKYIAHPINIDAMLQTAFVATTRGWARKLRAKVPVSIETVELSSPISLDMDTTKPWFMEAISEPFGFGTVNINAELINQHDDFLVRMVNVRAIRFQGNNARIDTNTEMKMPLVRVAWKPDITALPAGPNSCFSRYLDWFEETYSKSGIKICDLRLAGALDLVIFKFPSSRILAIDCQPGTIKLFRDSLRAEHHLRRFETFIAVKIADDGGMSVINDNTNMHSTSPTKPNGKGEESQLEDKFDIIVTSSTKKVAMVELLSPHGFFISIQGLEQDMRENATLEIIEEPSRIFPSVLVRNGQGCSSLNNKLQTMMSVLFGLQVPILNLDEVSGATIQPRAIVISTLEATAPLLSEISEDDMKRVQVLTDNASKILWITNGDLLSGKQPDYTLIRGIAGPLMLEQPALKLQVFDVDGPFTNVDVTVKNDRHFMEASFSNSSAPEPEVAQKDGIIHALRWEPEDVFNAQFDLKQKEGMTENTLGDIGRCELSIKEPGQMETLHFAAKEFEDLLPADHVEIHVRSVGLNAKDLYALAARVDTKGATCSCECSGVVTAIGESVSNFQVGDRVVVMAPGHFATYERFPEWAVCTLEDKEDLISYSPRLSIVFGIALIFSVESRSLFTRLLEDSRDSSFLDGIQAMTLGRGVDVVLNSLTGELLQDSFQACAEFGRFIEIGKKDILDHGRLDMATFGRNVSFTAVDLSRLYFSDQPAHHRQSHKLLQESMSLIRSKATLPCMLLKVFDVTNIEEAFRYFMRGTRMGKVAVTFQNPKGKLRVLPESYESKFSSSKSYLMVGCLGGLGRSLAKWMMSRGARRFVFLSRTSIDKPSARALVETLRDKVVEVEVIRGDVGIYEDVEQCVQATKTPIGGVMQGAMALHETFWGDMTPDRWHTVIRPKVQGTWHLHNVLRKDGRDSQLDWFVMTSSTAGTIGAATESNYCAANAFQDAFARYHNNLGLPAIVIGYGRIAGVGYLHEHPEIEAIMDRRGIQATSEDEMIQIMDLAIAHQHPSKWQPGYDRLANAHLLTGIDFSGLQLQRNHGFEGDIHFLSDPRASLFAAAFRRRNLSPDTANGGIPSALVQGLPAEVAKTLAEGDGSLCDAVQGIICKKMANLILLPQNKLRLDQRLGDFGIDSMLAAEFRTYIFHALEIDVPFMMLLDKSTTVGSLSAFVLEKLKNRHELPLE